MYEVGLSKSFAAWHMMPGVEGPEGELHSHDYRLDIVVAREDLDERGMVCDLDLLDAALDNVVGRIGGRDLDIIRPADAEAVTVEVLARWAHEQLAGHLAPGHQLLVRAWESPVAFGGYSAPVSKS